MLENVITGNWNSPRLIMVKKKKKSYIQALVMYFSEMVYMGMQIAIDM